eukprot:CAMPEP_0172538646 /NCGR_PEP_ID=MMETSP1067-20121228/10004_1 /TAXON_ID=265564 ORGANISM="Thalassiosira punctigera, Strain Tpunct2005C2" /NCGR_SAMPLE_ID=MMETSP1067 /ASSEMBLY_ACC=CAM_ASM_000444 /LENGTH=85 /DNA_ID=CAMNT_0013324189 /DNA_START=27 /DNA_END=280 /DNA_ORIENTATION=+
MARESCLLSFFSPLHPVGISHAHRVSLLNLFIHRQSCTFAETGVAKESAQLSENEGDDSPQRMTEHGSLGEKKAKDGGVCGDEKT